MASFGGDNDTFRQEYRLIEGAVPIVLKMQRMVKRIFQQHFRRKQGFGFHPVCSFLCF